MNGIIPLWKPKGMTSAACVYRLRKILQIKKIGHTGTLDPDVEGVLPICIGNGTKLVEYLVDSHKTYHAEITFGFSTTTEDASGEVVETLPVNTGDITDNQLKEVLSSFLGDIIQVPPMYSAVKVNGRRLYDYARTGKTVKRPKRSAFIYTIEQTSQIKINDNNQTASVSVSITCSKGTYIRTLSVDIGKSLGFPAHMSKLTRTYSGGISKDQTVTFDDIENAVEHDSIDNVILPLVQVFTRYPQVELNENLYQRVINGAKLYKSNFSPDIKFPVSFVYNGDLVAIYKTYDKDETMIKPQKMIQVSR